MNLTDYHSKYFAYELTTRCPAGSVEKLAGAMASAQVDLNPHQVDAALFAFQSPLSSSVVGKLPVGQVAGHERAVHPDCPTSRDSGQIGPAGWSARGGGGSPGRIGGSAEARCAADAEQE